MSVDLATLADYPPLSDLIFSAKIDYLKLGSPTGKVPLSPLTGKLFWSKKEGHRTFTVHDPSPADVRNLARRHETLSLLEMEVAVDVSCRSSVALQDREFRLQQVMVGLFAKGLNPHYRGIQPVFRGAWHFGGPKPFNKRLPSPDAQLLYGHRSDGWQTKAYLKRVDMGAALPEALWVARVEVALRLEQLDLMGLRTMGDVPGFRFRSELSPFFAHVRGVEPRAMRKRRKSDLQHLLLVRQSEYLNDEFARAGIGAIHRGGRHESVETRAVRDRVANNRIGQALHRLQSSLTH